MTEREVTEYIKATLITKRNLFLKLAEQTSGESVEDKIKKSEHSGRAKAFSEMIIDIDNFSSLFVRGKE